MLSNRYQGQEEVRVKVLPSWGHYKSTRKPFKAKVVCHYHDAIAVLIDQWWVFFDHYGRQYGEYPYPASHPEFELY